MENHEKWVFLGVQILFITTVCLVNITKTPNLMILTMFFGISKKSLVFC